jgi:hypothetical protein
MIERNMKLVIIVCFYRVEQGRTEQDRNESNGANGTTGDVRVCVCCFVSCITVPYL